MSTITTRENSGIYRMLWVLFIFFAVVIGVYPFLYYITDMSKGGLLSSKPASLLQSAIYMGAFYSHITFGGLALLSGCSQFSKKIRNRYTRIHRTLGTIYFVRRICDPFWFRRIGCFVAILYTYGIQRYQA